MVKRGIHQVVEIGEAVRGRHFPLVPPAAVVTHNGPYVSNRNGARDAAEAMGVTAVRLKQLGLIDEMIKEPAGAAHRDPATMIATLKAALIRHLDQLALKPMPQLLEERYQRLRRYGDVQAA